MDNLLKDLGYAARTLRKNAGFTAIATATIALGIGACTAIFSVVNAALLRPLPYSDAERLVLVWGELRARNVNDWPFSPPDYRAVETQTTAFEELAGLTPANWTPIGGDDREPEQIRVAAATPNLFRMLGAPMAAGRDFTADDAAPLAAPPQVQPGQPPPQPPPQAVIISHSLWQRRYNSDEKVLNRVIEIGNGGRAQIVGVLSPGFEVLFPPRVNIPRLPDMWTAPRINYETANPHNVIWRVIAKLEPGASVEQARAEVDQVGAALRKQYPLKETAGLYFHVVPMHDDLVREARPAILWLMGAVAFVLLIACANVGNLLLVRASARGRELAIRAAIGGSRGRLVRQLLAESVLLASIGTVAGVLLARLAIVVLAALAPDTLPRLDLVGIDPVVLTFAVVAGLATAVICGVVPALRASRPDLMDTLRTAGTPGLRGGRAVRNAFVVAEVVLSFVLLIGTGLMIRSFLALQRVDPGFNPNGLLTFRMPPRGQNPQAQADFIRRVRERLSALPTVTGVTAATSLPLDGTLNNARYGLEAARADQSLYKQADFKAVLPGYFETLGTSLVAGRTFTDADNATNARLIIIDEQIAARIFPGESPIGRTMLSRVITPEAEVFEVIGVVRHQRHRSLSGESADGMFFTVGYFGGGAVNWAVRTTGEPALLIGQVRAAIAEIDPRATLAQIRPMRELADGAMAPMRFATALLAGFAAIALLLAAVGLYGVLSTLVRQRTAEIGMRMVLGAKRSGVFTLVIREGLKLCAIGIAAGLALSLGLAQFIESQLVNVRPTDPWTFLTIPVVFTAVAVIACLLPASRAARLDPAVALRED
jgi:putative ABC transport system permease protein